MKRKFPVIVLSFAILIAACGPRPLAVSQETIETRVAATLAAFRAATGAAPSPVPTRIPASSPAPPTAAPLETSTPTSPDLKPPDSDSPAAGICGGSPEAIVPINIVAGTMPDVRCMQVRPEQRLQFKNETGAAVRLQLGRFDVTIPPGEVALLDTPCGSYLAPGSHFVTVSEGAVPEIWLVAE